MLLKYVIDNTRDPVMQMSLKTSLINPVLSDAIDVVINELHKQLSNIDMNADDIVIARRCREIRTQITVYQEIQTTIKQLIRASKQQ